MNKVLAVITVASSVLIAAQANAAVVVTSVGGSTLSPNFLGGVAGSAYITFDDVGGPLPNDTPFVSGGFTFTGDAAVVLGNVGGKYANPAGDATQYMSTGFTGADGLQTTSVVFGGPGYRNFGLYWGSIDRYNTLTFYSGATQVASYGGCDIAPSVCDGNQAIDATNRYVNFAFTGLDSFDRIVFTSTSPAFEVDNLALANAAPELSTWMMMLLGFAGVGYVAYRRSRVRPERLQEA